MPKQQTLDNGHSLYSVLSNHPSVTKFIARLAIQHEATPFVKNLSDLQQALYSDSSKQNDVYNIVVK